MIKHTLNLILNGRSAEDMTTSEAKKVVAEFYEKIMRMTFGQRHPEKVDYLCKVALESVGLGYFA